MLNSKLIDRFSSDKNCSLSHTVCLISGSDPIKQYRNNKKGNTFGIHYLVLLVYPENMTC